MLRKINFSGYEVISDNFNISAAVVVPPGLRILATSGHVGMDSKGHVPDSLDEQMKLAFENVEKSILAAEPSLTKEEAWKSVYQITTYHKGGLGEDVIKLLFATAENMMGSHAPASTAVGVEELAFGRIEISVFAALPSKE